MWKIIKNINHIIIRSLLQNVLCEIKKLVQNGHSLYNTNDTFLMVACRCGQFEIFKYLVEHDALINEIDSCKISALIRCF